MMPRLAAIAFLTWSMPVCALAQQPPDAEWRLRVVDPSGAAMEGVSISAGRWSASRSVGQILDGAVTSTGAEGRATWRASANGVAWIAAEGFVPRIVQSAESLAWEGVVDLGRIVLHPGKPLVGVVRDAAREGIEGAAVTLNPSASNHHGHPSIRAHLFAETDESGIFKIPAVPDGAFDLSLSHDGYLGRTVHCVTPLSPLDITLDPGALITGRAVASAGAVPRVLSEARTEIGRFYGQHQEDGTFSIRVPSGVRYRLAFRGGAVRSTQLFGGIAIGPQDGVEWVVPETAPELEVRCQTAEGDPVPDFEAFVRWSQEHQPPFSNMAPRFRGAVAAREGVAKLSVDRAWRPGRGVLRVRAPGHGETYVPIDAPPEGQPPGPVLVTVAPEVVVRGRVLRADTGEPIAGVKVWGMPNKKGWIGYSVPSDVAVLTDDAGRYELRQLAPGTWTLEVHKPGWFRPYSEQLELDPAVESVVTMNDVELVPPETVQVQVEGLDDPERWFVEHRISPPNNGMAFVPDGHAFVRQAASLREPSPWISSLGEISVSVFTLSQGTHPYVIRRAASWKPGDDGVVKVVVEDGWVCRVAGRWRADDRAFSERLGVRAVPSGSGFSGGWGEIRADGTWGFEVVPGRYAFSVVDLATGLELWRGEPIDVFEDDDEVEIDPRFEAVALEFAARDATWPVPVKAVAMDGLYLPRELETLLLPPRPMTLTYYRTPLGWLNSTGPYMLPQDTDPFESEWQPGTERWVIQAPAPLSDAELLQAPGTGG